MKNILPGPAKVSYLAPHFLAPLVHTGIFNKTIFIPLFVFIHHQGWQRFQISKTK